MIQNFTFRADFSSQVIKGLLCYIFIYLLSGCVQDQSSKTPVTKSGKEISEWREENRTGYSDEKGLLDNWPVKGPELLWSNEELLTGYSSVTFGKNSIFITGIDGKDEFLFCLDLKGKIKWKTRYGRAWNGPSPESRCTPTVAGEKVFVSSGLGDLACINAGNGDIIWMVKASEDFHGTYGTWGIAESLVVDGEKVYFTPGGPETTTIALNRNTGELIWKSPSLDDSPAYVSPLLIDFKGGKFLVNISLRYVFAVDVSDGDIVWKINHVDSLNPENNRKIWPDAPWIKCVTPLFSDGQIYITGGYDHGSMMLKLTDEGRAAGILWKDTVLDVHHGGVVLVNGYIYGSNWTSNNNGNWCCLDWNTGEKMYEENWKCKGSVIAAEGMLYLYDEKSGYVGLVRANPEKFDLVSSFRITQGSGPFWSHPVIKEGNLYLRHGNALMAYNIKAF